MPTRRIGEPISLASNSLRNDKSSKPRKVIQDDSMFMLNHVLQNGLAAPASIRKRAAPLKNKRENRLRAEAEEAAASVIRHRIEANVKRYPDIFSIIRNDGFVYWYEATAGRPWNKEFEADIDQLRFEYLIALGFEERKSMAAAERAAIPVQILMEPDLGKRRRLVISLATPAWADFSKMALVYKERDRLTEETGTQHHVDHIIPLQNRFVCGLHVEHNLRAIPWMVNIQKSNKFDTEQFWE